MILKNLGEKKSPSKPKLSDHAIHLLTDSHKDLAKDIPAVPGHWAGIPERVIYHRSPPPSHLRERGPVSTGWQTIAPSSCDSVGPHCQQNNQGFSTGPLGRADAGRTLETYNTQVQHQAAPLGSPAEKMATSQRFMEPE